MPNYCNYSMCVVGKQRKNVEEFIKVINADYNYGTMEFSYDRHMFRVFEATADEIEDRGDGTFEVIINGYCAWSVASCMLEHGYYRDVKRDYPDNFRGTTLPLESKRLGLDIEVFSEESGMCFQEHYIISNGELEVDETEDWEEIWVEDYETKEDAEEDLEIKITDEEWEIGSEEGYFTRGGFDWDFEI
jgi:hypothetical protein